MDGPGLNKAMGCKEYAIAAARRHVKKRTGAARVLKAPDFPQEMTLP